MGYLDYRKSISNELLETSGRFRQLVNFSHFPEDGRYKEIILRSIIRKSMPDDVKIGTGFIINEKDEVSNQIDIIVYNSLIPPLFIAEDLVIVTASSVFAVIEVKTSMTYDGLCDALEKGEKTSRILNNPDIFNGIFFYSYKRNLEKGLTINEEKAFKESGGYINNLCLGKNFFAKLWINGNPKLLNRKKCYSFYNIQNLSFGYFISNLVEDVMHMQGKKVSKDLQKFLYPLEESKEVHRMIPCEITFDE